MTKKGSEPLQHFSFLLKEFIRRQKNNFTKLMKNCFWTDPSKKLNFYNTVLVLVPGRCNDLAKPIAATCAKAHSARFIGGELVDGNLW